MTGTRILVVEDETIVAHDLARCLGDMGYEVVGTAADAQEGLAKARSASPDLVLMDIKLQGAMDGIEAARRMLHELDVPVLYLTGYTDEATLRRAGAIEPSALVRKPYEPEQLRASLELALHRHRRETARRLVAEEHRAYLVSIVEGVRDAIVAIDLSSRIATWNPGAEALFGYRAEEMLGQPFDRLAPPGDMARDTATALHEALAGRRVDERRASLVAKDGTTREVAWSLTPIRSSAGRLVGATAILRALADPPEADTPTHRAGEPAGSASVATPEAAWIDPARP